MNNYYVKIVIVFLIVIALAEAIPEIVNSFLILVLVGIFLGHWETFAKLLAGIGVK